MNEEPKKLTNVCNACWHLCDENWNKVRAMLPNDDSKFLSHGPCNECLPDLKAQVALYRSVQHSREIQLTRSLHNQINQAASRRPYAAATL